MESPVDLVYCWCDDADAVWREKRDRFAAERGYVMSGHESGACRYRSNDDLRFSLRSVGLYAPFVRRVFVVVDDDAASPPWLDASSGRVRVVRHGEIMPRDALPSFNSVAIEHFLHRIPGLSERFLYANDDMMFNRRLDERFFYASDGLPVCRYAGRYDTYAKRGLPVPSYNQMLRNSDEIVRRDFGLAGDFARAYGMHPHHNVDAYLKSDIEACAEHFGAEAFGESHPPFRTGRELLRFVYSAYALAAGRAHFRLARFRVGTKRPWYKRLLRPAYADSLVFPAAKWRTAEALLAKYRPGLFCFNDSADATPADLEWLAGFYRRRFPSPSPFERAGS